MSGCIAYDGLSCRPIIIHQPLVCTSDQDILNESIKTHTMCKLKINPYKEQLYIKYNKQKSCNKNDKYMKKGPHSQ